MRLRPVILLGAIVGLLAGIVAALAIPQTRAAGGGAGGTPITAPVPDPGSSTVKHIAKAQPPPGDTLLVVRGKIRIEARAADPLGGPQWAVRVFEADRVLKRGSRRPGVSPVIGHNLCAQLGRIHDGAFGWLDAAGTFRPVLPGIVGRGTTSWCGSQRPTVGGNPPLIAVSTITDPDAPVAAVKSTVAWGLGGSGARAVTLRVAGRATTPDATPHHAFVAVAGPEVDQRQVTATVAYPGGRTVRLPRERGLPGLPGGGTPRLAARAPDPNGGLPFAMVAARAPSGGWCTFAGGRVVGDRTGGVDYRQDVLSETQVTGGGSCGVPPEARARIFKVHPVLLASSGGSGDTPAEGGDAATGRVARRTQRGLMVFNGPAAPGVVSVTLETPRDVRTLIPSGPTHAIMAVYDGSFPTGGIRIVARFKDGHTQVDRLDVSF
jgi:hypothetical protein